MLYLNGINFRELENFAFREALFLANEVTLSKFEVIQGPVATLRYTIKYNKV